MAWSPAKQDSGEHIIYSLPSTPDRQIVYAAFAVEDVTKVAVSITATFSRMIHIPVLESFQEKQARTNLLFERARTTIVL
jgi:hypothetical protein